MAKTLTATVHNPSNFEPADYTVEDYLDNRRPMFCGGPIEYFEREIAEWQADMLRTFGPNWIRKIHSCAHCGNTNIRWITAVRHAPTNEVVVFGSDCTHHLGFKDRVSFKLAQVQARAEARKVRFTIYNKRQEFLAANPAMAEALAHAADPVHARNTFVQDVLAKLDRYGDLSDKQVAAVTASMARDRGYADRKAAEAVEPKGAAPSGRTAVTGLVLSLKEQESMYGFTLKMLVKLDNNAKVWVTVPGKATIERGDTVTVKATWTVSDTDPAFAYGKRPTIISVVQKEVAS